MKTRRDPLCSEASIREAREVQRLERAAVTAATGLVIHDDGRVTKAETDVLSARQSPDLKAN